VSRAASAAAAGDGLRLLRERNASLPDAIRLAAAGPVLASGIRAGDITGFVATGIGSSAAHARFLVHLLSHELGVPARFVPAGSFVTAPTPRSRNEALVVFSQGLSPNARFALAHPEAWRRVVLVTSTPADGGRRHDAEKRALFASLERHDACILRLPGTDEYGTLLRLIGPMVGYVAALRLASALHPPRLTFDVEAVCAAVAAASPRLDAALAGAALPTPGEAIAFLALGAGSELAENLRYKILEGLRRPAPPVWDLLHLAHGPWQELHERRTLLLALTRTGVGAEESTLARVEALLVAGRHRLLRLEAALPFPFSVLEHEALVNELVLRGIEAEGLDPALWPGSDGESALYEMAPAPKSGAAGGTARSPVPVVTEERALAALTSPEVDALLAAGCRTAVIPLGALEQHGPHLPLATDAQIADALAERFCAAVPEAMRLPALWAGCSREHLDFTGTIDLRPTTLEGLLVDVVDSLARHGFEQLFVFSAHAGNDLVLQSLLPALRAAAAPAKLIACTGLDALAEMQRLASAGEGVEAAAAGQHAGEYETSILLGLTPETVREDRLEAGHVESTAPAQALFYPSLRTNAPNGIVGDPRTASGARAERYLAAWTALLLASYRAEKNAR
jgi:creatinine amidohydrolase